jgi:predicted ATPase
MDLASNNFFVITGGPGSGKSTLLDYLEREGFARSNEAGRAVIQDQVSIDGPGLPWRNRSLFAELMLSWELRSYQMARQTRGIVLFDRGLPNVVGYLRLGSLDVPAHIMKAARTFRYNQLAFLAPPWPEIYTQDSERKQDSLTAQRTYEPMVTTYRELSYSLLELPKVDVAARAEFVKYHLRSRP